MLTSTIKGLIVARKLSPRNRLLARNLDIIPLRDYRARANLLLSGTLADLKPSASPFNFGTLGLSLPKPRQADEPFQSREHGPQSSQI
jgi:hypothetical protein